MNYLLIIILVIVAFLAGRFFLLVKHRDNNQGKDDVIEYLRGRVMELQIEVDRESARKSKMHFVVTEDVYKDLQQVNDETFRAYEHYLEVTQNIKMIFIQEASKNSDIIRAMRSSIELYGLEETKKIFIGTSFKELFYKSDAQIEEESITINRKNYLLYDALLTEKYLENLEKSIF